MAKKKAWQAWADDKTGVGSFMVSTAVYMFAADWLIIVEVSGINEAARSVLSTIRRDILLSDFTGNWVLPGAACVALYIYHEHHRRAWLGKLGKVIAFVWLGLQSAVSAAFVLVPDKLASIHVQGEGGFGLLHRDILSTGTSLEVNWLWLTVAGALLAAAWAFYFGMGDAEDGSSAHELKKAKEAEEAKNAKKAARKAAKEAKKASEVESET